MVKWYEQHTNSARINEAGDRGRVWLFRQNTSQILPSPLQPPFLVSCRAAFASKIALRGKETMNGVPFHGHVG